MALAEAEKTGILAAAEISPHFDDASFESQGLQIMILEGRIAVLEQRLLFMMRRLMPTFGAELP
jgi:hypothetical protein